MVVAIVGLGILLLGCLFYYWNDIIYALPATFRCSSAGGGRRSRAPLPPGYMGFPFIGEMFNFLYYFKFLGGPDDFINAKRAKYGGTGGLYRTHLFGSPAIIVCSPAANKFVFQSEANFQLEWPAVEIVGKSSLVAVHGESHTRIRSLVVKTTNQPDALRRIAEMVQPRIVHALQTWAKKGRILGYHEAKKVTFENIGNYFVSIEPGTQLDVLDKLFAGMVKGIRSFPINLPGTAYHHAIQCRKKAVAIFQEELDKHRDGFASQKTRNDLMDGLMNLKDEEGKQLSDVEVVDNIVSLVVAGYESTSISIMWALYYLAKYPSVIRKLQEEHSSICTNGDQYVTSDDIQKLQYTTKVVEETIRLANTASIIFRKARNDVDYKGVRRFLT
ncbi:OLC1v1012756C1 [Oldenlandia corymbosa var. corymbosa]|uniref:OLC1v1012756C1 n=1 Tax=Oldenlandia corymbosa var. corymbosa TaxID=529605 RepID=A0AAV1DZV9_OLDCO|nr:OLC1v1012756C1 [Oldenlandia corymbosa var. corymbosa]